MKPYGQPKGAATNRKLRGTSRPCSCCIPHDSWSKSRRFKKRARQIAKMQIVWTPSCE